MGEEQLSKLTGVRRRGGLPGAVVVAVVLSLLIPASALADPETTIDSGPTNQTSDVSPTFVFSSDDPVATFECRLDSEAFAACSTPATIGPLFDGPHTFRVRAIDSASNPDPTPASQTFTVDTTPPDTTIDSGPNDTISNDTPTFAFSSDEPGSTFECRIDSDPFAVCSGPGDTHTTASLSDGPHNFEVRAIDAASNPDPTPAIRSFTVDTTGPGTTIDSGPAGTTADNTPTFAFSSEAGSTFKCRIDSDPFAACSGPGNTHTTASLPDGLHTFAVRAFDSLANPGPTATRSFTVDTTGPGTTIDSGPAGTTADNTPTFAFSSEAGSTFKCRIDSDPFAACSGPGNTHTTASLPDGLHTFAVRAFDSVSNPGLTASRGFTVDTTPPETTIDAGPTDPTSNDTPTFAFSSDEPGSIFECKLDGDPFGACSGPGDTHMSESLSDGPHTFAVRAIDSVSNIDPTAATRRFTVDTTGPPDTTVFKRPGSKVKTRKKKTKVKISFTAEAGASFRCKLDRARYKPCASPYSARVKAKGVKGKKHTILVQATDELGNVGDPVTVKFKVARIRPLSGSVARRTVATALKRHGFAHRVVKSVHAKCHRSSRYAFGCRFSGHFPGYRLKGRGQVKRVAHLSYRFRVKAQGVRFTLTDNNEATRSR